MEAADHPTEPNGRAPSRVAHVVALMAVVFGLSAIGTVVASSIGAAQAGALIEGVDVSNWQGNINWSQVPSNEIRFAFIKASEGRTYADPYFQRNWNGAAAAGIYRGAYHFARPEGSTTAEIEADARAEAYWFVSQIGGLGGPLDLPAVLDFEYPGDYNSRTSPPGYKCWYMSSDQLAHWMRTWLGTVQSLTGKVPILYTNSDYWNTCDGRPADIAANYRLWLASWGVSNPSVPSPWSSWTFWQDGGADVPGIGNGIDHNYFCCSESALAALAGGGGGSPFGAIDSFSVTSPTTASVSGWAIDPDTRDPIQVHVYVDGQGYASTADGYRPDIGGAYIGFGANHGYSASVPLPLGARSLCVYGINARLGGNSLLGCRSLGGEPFGVIDSATAAGPGRIALSGWSIDPNGSTSTRIVIRAGGTETAIVADGARGDLVGYGLGTAHGFSATVNVPSGGSQQVCVSAENSIGPGGTGSLGCRTVNLASGNPIGVVDSAVGGLGSITLSGWAFDPDTATSTDVHVYVDGVGTAFRANQQRPDIGAAYPGYGASHGFGGTVSARSGTRTACAYGINLGAGTNVLLGCRTVQVAGGVPVGVLDSVTFTGNAISVSGWALDPDTAASIPVHVYLQGQGYALTANGSRPDLAGPYPFNGTAHGFGGTIPAPEGTHNVCAFAIDIVGGDGNRIISCRSVTVPPGNPVGVIDSVVLSGGLVSASGWALDPNTSDSTRVHIYLNGVGYEVVANGDRPDLVGPYGVGPAHGFSFSAPRVGSGTQRVCVHALNIAGSGSNQLLGCRDLS